MSAAIAGESPRLSDRTVALAMAAMTAVVLIVALWATRSVDPIRSDTASYLYFDPTRTAGYPAFLALVRLLTGRVALAAPIQTLLLAGSLFLLGWSFHRVARRTAWSLAFQALVLCSPLLWKTSASLLTEALATACAALWCAQALRMLRDESLRGAALLVAISAIATTIRPSLLALFFATALFAIVRLQDRDRWRALAITAAGMTLAWIATPIAVRLVDPNAEATSPFARGILQHSLFCAPPAVPNDPDARFVERNAAAARQYVESAPPAIRPALRRYYSAQLRFSLIIPALGREHHLNASWQTDPIVSRLAWQRLAANPLCYAASVAIADYRMATYQNTLTAGEARLAREFIRANPPIDLPSLPLLPYDQHLADKAAAEIHGAATADPPDRELTVPDKSPAILVWIARLLYAAAASFGLAAIFALFRRSSLAPELRGTLTVAAAMGAAFHGVLGITAIVELGLSRYAVPVWPLVCTIIGLVAVAALESLRQGTSFGDAAYQT